MLQRVRVISSLAVILIAFIAGVVLFFNYVIWPNQLGLAGVIDIAIGGIVLLVMWIRALRKPKPEEKQNCATHLLRWLGPLLATFLFIGLYQLINAFDTQQQYGCLYGWVMVLLMILPAILLPAPYKDVDDSDDYHASRG